MQRLASLHFRISEKIARPLCYEGASALVSIGSVERRCWPTIWMQPKSMTDACQTQTRKLWRIDPSSYCAFH